MTGAGFDITVDELTLARAKRGDMSACEKVYRQFHQQAFNLAYRICNQHEMAQDVTHEAFISVFRRMKQYRGDAPFWGWLRRVVVNHAISALRRLPRQEGVMFEDYMASSSGEQENLGRCMDLEQALTQLDNEDRMVVWLHDVEGYKHREIARLVGKTESYSKTRLNRARAKLRDLIGDAGAAGVINAQANASA
jgi:RNA polymerase sigma-70 factor (ECF subfamily)